MDWFELGLIFFGYNYVFFESFVYICIMFLMELCDEIVEVGIDRSFYWIV